MSEIDPHNLGEPVYRSGEVITADDLKMWEEIFKEVQMKASLLGAHSYAEIAHQLRHAMEDFQLWIDEGKQDVREWDPRRKECEHGYEDEATD